MLVISSSIVEAALLLLLITSDNFAAPNGMLRAALAAATP
jgi:hypothetical protein